MGFSAGPKLLLKAFRLPAAFGSAAIAALAYANYKVQEAANYTKGIFSSISGWCMQSTISTKEQLDSIWNNNFSGFFNRVREESRPSKDDSSPDPSSSQSEKKQPDLGSALLSTAVGVSAASKEEDSKEDAGDGMMMTLTKKMIEIRNILQKASIPEAVQLPSIVVIGSQSSGKSSVLEAIVGHEFLPKGGNMVTRRPIELTLINTPGTLDEYGEFSDLENGRVSDFSGIQKTLMDLNLAVSEAECVSDDPIRLKIYSPNIPDLSLIDLPGYIQVSAKDQPQSLKAKIASLCDKYIQEPNIILAISAADVDLANSTALLASRKVDPNGRRTIGVVTKIDLVEPDRAVVMLQDKNYPLHLGYVGVVCRVPNSTIFSRNSSILSAVARNEKKYFATHPQFSSGEGCTVGTTALRQKLVHILESSMSGSLKRTTEAIHDELEEANYQFKVEFNDRPLTPETFLAESLDTFKHLFKDFSNKFGRAQVREILKGEFEQKLLDILAHRYWNKPLTGNKSVSIFSLPLSSTDDLYWQRKLDASTSALTKLGVGRLATTLLVSSLTLQVDSLVTNSPFRNHPFAREIILQGAREILDKGFLSTSDQVENCIKPFKFDIEVDDREWASGREQVAQLLSTEIKQCEVAYLKLAQKVGEKRLNKAVASVNQERHRGAIEIQDGQDGQDGFVMNQSLLRQGKYSALKLQLTHKGEQALFLRERLEILKLRQLAIRSKQCRSKENKHYCPEIFLEVVAEKLTTTSVLFLNVELLSSFYYTVSNP